MPSVDTVTLSLLIVLNDTAPLQTLAGGDIHFSKESVL